MKLVIPLSLFLATLLTDVQASEINNDSSVGWIAHFDLKDEQFSALFSELSDDGYRLVDVDAAEAGSDVRYSMVWQKNDGRGWAEHRKMSSEEYQQRWVEYRDRGYRPTDVEALDTKDGLRFAGIWIENREDTNWKSWRSMDSTTYGERFDEMSDEGFLLVDMEAYDTSNGFRYAAIWMENDSNIPWAQHRDMSRDKYQERVDDYSSRGYEMVDYERYKKNGATLYAAIWHKSDTLEPRVIRTNRNKNDYRKLWVSLRDDGYRPVDFERDGSQYGTIWARNNTTRANYKHRKSLDNKLQNYRESNDVPGMSAAVVYKGKTVWQAGAGKTDQLGNQAAHGKTVYRMASISKVVGGTLFGRLEDSGSMRNGISVDIESEDYVRSHVPTLEQRYTQTLGQLMAHTGCIKHYDGVLSNPILQYNSQIEALEAIDGREFLTDCTIGEGPEKYSTHAYTFLGAAIESSTNRTIDQLIQQEFSIPHRLPSLRMMYGPDGLASDNNRSSLFESGVVIPGLNNSWKALGGGLESNARDLARFGWLAASGRITTENFRDTHLMERQENSIYAYGWHMRSYDRRRVARHGGSTPGGRSELMTWPSHDLSIAIMSNYQNHDGLPNLAAEMGDLILDNP